MYTIQCDFDDTITVNNVSEELRKTYASEEWRGIEDGYKAGQFSVEESNRRQFALIQATEERIEQYVIQTTVVRPGFSAFVKYCQGEGIQLAVVSSGVDLYIDPILRDLGLGDLERYSGTGRVSNHGVTVRYADPFGAPLEGGLQAGAPSVFEAKATASHLHRRRSIRHCARRSGRLRYREKRPCGVLSLQVPPSLQVP